MTSTSTNLKLHYENLLKQDSPFIDKFGTPQQKQTWSATSQLLFESKSNDDIMKHALVMGKIRDYIHKKYEDSTVYRIFYLQHGPQTYEQIKSNLGKELADVVQDLRNKKDVT
jgi:hypothetical protein